MEYKIYRTDNAVEVRVTKKPLELEEMQKIVGGYIEMLAYGEELYAVVNEEGRIKRLPQNPFFPEFVGNVILGKLKDSEFVGI